MKKLLVIAIAAFAFTACNNAAKTEETTATDSPAATTEPTATTPVDTTANATPVDTTAKTTEAAH